MSIRMTLTGALLAGCALAAGATQSDVALQFEGRTLYVHVPERLPGPGSRALVVVLHGGLGNAERIVEARSEAGMNLDAAADRYGFLVAYLNGTPVARRLGDDRKGWNAGECCGLSAERNVDDVGYIRGAVADLERRYGVDARRVYGVGHSNGAMMTLRLMCETDLYAAALPVSGALEIEATACPAARGKRILALRGELDENVPMAGGRGRGLARMDFKSQEYTRRAFAGSGARYTLQVLPGAAHSFESLQQALRRTEGIDFAQKAVRFFGLDRALRR